MLELEDFRRYYIYCIEGGLRGGKSLLGTILAHKHSWFDNVSIASNMDFPSLDCERLHSEEQLFDLEDTLIFLDEFDLLANYQSQQDSRVYYENLVKTLGKNNNVLIIMTQMSHLLPRKLRDIMELNGLICYPYITNRFETIVKVKWNGQKIKTDVTPISTLQYQWYNFNVSMCRSNVNRIMLKTYFGRFEEKNLWFWFDKYNTKQKPEGLELTEVRDRKRKKKKHRFIDSVSS